MRRQDIQLLSSARQGDTVARCEVARRYLLGVDGFPRHLSTGLEYLAHPSIAGTSKASAIVAETLPLHEIVHHDQLAVLAAAARAGSPTAQVKCGLWACLTKRDTPEALAWFRLASQSGDVAAGNALRLLSRSSSGELLEVLRALAAYPGVDLRELLMHAMRCALHAHDADLLAEVLDCMLTLQPGTHPVLADSVCAALQSAQKMPRFAAAAPVERIEALLENCVLRGKADAALLLGRALCGIDHGPLRAVMLATAQNMRKGAALLLRAADAGKDEAWMHLYRVHADSRTSVANPQMARFFLEKAAVRGNVEAQRRLGALTLRSASTLHESEQGIHWLHQAAQHGDTNAARLLGSLVLKVPGLDSDAAIVIESIRREDPWMACRLRTARDFGLTKLEGLSVDVIAGKRPWGLVVGPNPFIAQVKLSAPRAIPALTEEAALNLRRSASFFEQARESGSPLEGDLRKRSVRLRRLLEHHGGDDSMFFAEARSTTLEMLRLGTKWAFHERQPLRVALAA
ncbi:MAG: sel1 repeat family protein [Rubrivivax sp.]|nr:sel1 repeat family protein [Rubrivivax sp.]